MHACFLISVDLAGLPSVFLTNHGQSRTKCTGGMHTNLCAIFFLSFCVSGSRARAVNTVLLARKKGKFC